MQNQQTGQAETAPRTWPVKNIIILVGVLLIASFLAGFLPSYASEKRLEDELRSARQEIGLLELRDLCGQVYLQAIQQDYGLAASTSTEFFDRIGEVINQTSDSGDRESLEELLRDRDRITSALAKGEPAVLSVLQALLVTTRRATANSAGTRKLD
jgi:hypothetical protein